MATIQERTEQQVPVEGPAPGEKHRSLWGDVWRQFKRHKGAIGGLVVLTIIVLASVVGPFFYWYDPFAIDTSLSNQGPSSAHWMGTE